MEFLNNKYTKIYYKIIESAKATPFTGYTERHHIIPRCCGGTDDDINLVALSARQHFICHLLLTKMVSETNIQSKLKYAAILFQTRDEVTITSRIYETLKTGLSQDEEWVRRRVESKRGYRHSEETIAKMQLKAKQRHVVYATCLECHKTMDYSNYISKHGEKCGTYTQVAWNKGKTMSTKGKKAKQTTCEHCGKQTDYGNYARWHGSKCKKAINETM